MRRAARVALVAMVAPAIPAAGQSLNDRAAAMERGTILFDYPARDGVCGNGFGGIRITRSLDSGFAAEPTWEPACFAGPVRGGRVVDLETNVGGRWRNAEAALDLGSLPPESAARLLLDFARRASAEPGEDAILPAILARGVDPWPELLVIARDARIPSDTREQTAFWLGHAAGERMAGEIEGLADDETVDLPVREAALHALSELDDDAGVVALLRIARTSPSRRIRERALFWLAETGDPRALALFEEILLR